ncbi:SAM-dependent methyltransferase [Streptacidiphilus sp. P02-A3a]|nr:SAM-dependent methyltransferase [Streptacidiphilus sp. P02-A3a]
MWGTAVGVARVRAMESRREHALFHDPLAAAFAAAGGLSLRPVVPGPGAAARDEARQRRWGGVALSIVIRTRFLDDLLTRAAEAGCRQVVLLGAGMDSRAYRLDRPPGTRLFELDTAEPLAFKESVLRTERAVPRCERRVVAVDLREDWPAALAAAGHDPALPTAWIAEGLLIYLPQEDVQRLLERVGGLSAPGSRMGLTLDSQQTLERFGQDRGTPADMWVSAMPDDPVGWLADLGWDAETFSIRERAAAYGRPVAEPAPAEAPTRPPGGLVSAVRR